MTSKNFLLLLLLLTSTYWYSCNSENQTTHPTETATPTTVSMEELKPNFEHFGSYDLSSWEKVPVQKIEDEGDVTIETEMFKKGNLTMKVETLKSEYYYGLEHTLKGADDQVQKKRSFHYYNDPKEIIEIVSDYTVVPPKQFTRRQNHDKPYQQLGQLPAVATGEWREGQAQPEED